MRFIARNAAQHMIVMVEWNQLEYQHLGNATACVLGFNRRRGRRAEGAVAPTHMAVAVAIVAQCLDFSAAKCGGRRRSVCAITDIVQTKRPGDSVIGF